MSKALKNKVKLNEAVNVSDFGAVGDGTTDDTAAIQAAVAYAASLYGDNRWYEADVYDKPRIVDFNGVYRVAGKILVPTGVLLRGNNSTLIGNGNSSGSNTCFESAYYNSGVLTTNVGTPPETHIVNFMSIQGFKFVNFKQALNLYNCLTGCEYSDLAFSKCWQPLKAARCFYAGFKNISSREPDVTSPSVAASTEPALWFDEYVNAQLMDSLSVEKRALGIRYSGGVNGLGLRNVSVENGTKGIEFLGEVNPIDIGAGCYFESLTGTALDFTDTSAHRAVVIDNVWFNLCGKAIEGRQMIGGRIGAGNYYLACTTNVSLLDNTCTIEVEIPRKRTTDSGSTVPTAPAKYSLQQSTLVTSPETVFSSVSGQDALRNPTVLDSVLELPYFGACYNIGNAVPFCSTSTSGTTTMTIYVDTKITWNTYVMGIFSLKCTDNISNYQINGRFYGSTVVLDTASGKTVTASNNGGYVRLTLTSFSHPSGIAIVEGIVRVV